MRHPFEGARTCVIGLFRFNRAALIRITLLIFLGVPAIAWAFVKPVRALAPQLADLHCAAAVCVDDEAKTAQARQLLSDATADVERKLGPFHRQPKMIFCATQACADHFGLGARSAVTLGTAVTVIGPRAWKPHYVRHELIHHAQGDHIGVLPLLLQPGWIVEGMAYGLSDDPRQPLAEPFESQRRAFLGWYGRIDQQHIWQEVARR